jgi:hypothetical protein
VSKRRRPEPKRSCSVGAGHVQHVISIHFGNCPWLILPATVLPPTKNPGCPPCPTVWSHQGNCTLQSVNPNRPATWLCHASMRVITHDAAHQCNVGDPWFAHFAHASAFHDATLIEAEQQRDATILGRLPADCADSCQALRAAHAAMDDLRRDYDAWCERNHTPRHPVAGLLQPSLPLALRAATTPRSSVQPSVRSRRPHPCSPLSGS